MNLILQTSRFLYHGHLPVTDHMVELKKLITNVIYDPRHDIQSRNKWPQAVIIALQALNATPIQNINYSREQIMFRFEHFIQLCKWSAPYLSKLDKDRIETH